LGRLLWRPSELWSADDVEAFFRLRPWLHHEAEVVLEPRLLEVKDQRYDELSDEHQCLCILASSLDKGKVSGHRGDRGSPFWINYRDLLVNPLHAAQLARFLEARKSRKKRRPSEEAAGRATRPRARAARRGAA